FMSGVVAEARRTGYTTTVFGRRRYLPELASGNFRVRQTGERMALNAPIQGSAADLIKMAMIRLDERLGELGLAGRQLLQIHDELVLEVPLDEVARTVDLTRTVMEGVAELKVRLRVDTATGRTLADTKS
ncbi:MAG: DNA polymerase I, partial [Acidimicrobiia bacterium]|nr:DNA polymerase I [Acidimicrobiia bacterium]